MTSRSAELWRLHVFDGPIGNLGSDDDVQQSCDAEKPGHPLQGELAIEDDFGQPFANLALAEIDTDRDQRQPGKEDRRKNEEDDDPNVRIIDVSANLLRQHKEPRNQGGRNQSHAQQTQPVLSEQKPYRPVIRGTH